jgi:hypothetical protein
MPLAETRFVNGWKEKLPDYQFFLWNEDNFDVNTSKFTRLAADAEKWGFIPDYLRAYAIYNFGGIFLDVDIEVLKPFDNLLDNICFAGFEDETHINPGSIFAGEKGCAVAREIMNFYSNHNFINRDGKLNLTTSPIVLSKILEKYGVVLDNSYQELGCFTVYPTEYFCPKSFITGLSNITNNTYSIHHFSGSWLSDETKQNVKFRWYFYGKIGHDKYLVDLYESYAEYIEDSSIYNRSLKNLYKYILRRTLNKIYKSIFNLRKKKSTMLQNENRKRDTNNTFIFFYDPHKKSQCSFSLNLGYYIQTAAAKIAIKKSFSDFLYCDITQIKNRNGRESICVMHQAGPLCTDPSLSDGRILPVYIDTHLSRKDQMSLLQYSLRKTNYLSNTEIGCRDLFTLDFCRRNNIKSYFSRCLSLSLPKRETTETQNKIFFFDFPKSIRKFIPDSISKNAVEIDQYIKDIYLTKNRRPGLMAQNLLNTFSSQARLILTQQLDTALCCLAMEIPFILICLSEEQRGRFSVLKGLVNYYTPNDFFNNSINYDFYPPDIGELKSLILENLYLTVKKAKGDKVSCSELTSLRNDIENYSITTF